MLPKRRTLLIVAVSLIAGMILASGLFIFLSNSSQPKGTTEGLTLVGNVSLKAYHSDGTLFYSANGHNQITLIGANNLVACFTGEGNVLSSTNPVPCSDIQSSSSPYGYPPNGLISGVWINNQAYTEAFSHNINSGTSFGTVPATLFSGSSLSGLQAASVVITNPQAGEAGCPSSAPDGQCVGWNVTGLINPSSLCTFSTSIGVSYCSGVFPYTVESAGVGLWLPPSVKGPNSQTLLPFDAINLCTGCQAQTVTLNSGDTIQLTVAFIVTT